MPDSAIASPCGFHILLSFDVDPSVNNMETLAAESNPFANAPPNPPSRAQHPPRGEAAFPGNNNPALSWFPQPAPANVVLAASHAREQPGWPKPAFPLGPSVVGRQNGRILRPARAYHFHGSADAVGPANHQHRTVPSAAKTDRASSRPRKGWQGSVG
jgi:hypothetical protein